MSHTHARNYEAECDRRESMIRKLFTWFSGLFKRKVVEPEVIIAPEVEAPREVSRGYKRTRGYRNWMNRRIAMPTIVDNEHVMLPFSRNIYRVQRDGWRFVRKAK